MSELDYLQKNELRKIITSGYNVQEMKLLCQNLGVNWEDVGATEITRNMFAQEIVDYFDRRGWLDDLIQRIQEDRPNLFYRPNSDYQESTTSDNLDETNSTQVSTASNSNNKESWIYFSLFAIFAIFMGYLVLDTQHQQQQQWQQQQKEPDIFVTTYINLLDEASFQSAWERLSGDYRINKHPTGYTPYAQYYASFKKVEILKVEVVEETDTIASVRVFLALTNYDNSVINQDILYKLSRPKVSDSWLIVDSNP